MVSARDGLDRQRGAGIGTAEAEPGHGFDYIGFTADGVADQPRVSVWPMCVFRSLPGAASLAAPRGTAATGARVPNLAAWARLGVMRVRRLTPWPLAPGKQGAGALAVEPNLNLRESIRGLQPNR